MEDGVDAVRGRMSGLMAGCSGRARCSGSGSVDEHRVERSNRGKMRKILWMEIGEKVGEC